MVFPNEIFIGAGNYNPYEDKIYFSSTQGIYKCDFSKKEGITNVELVFSPKLIWKQEPLAIGVDTSTKQLYFRENGDLILVTESNGIGIYRNENLVWLK